MARCRREIAAIEELIRSGHPDLQGLCLGLTDLVGRAADDRAGGGLEHEKARPGRSRAGQEGGGA